MMENYLNHLLYNKILDQSKLKAFSDNKINITEKLDRKSRKHCGKRRKCWLPAFSLFPTMFSKRLHSKGFYNSGLWDKE